MLPRFIKACKIDYPFAILARHAGRLRCRNAQAFIFVATTGRTGTRSLRQILACIPGAVAMHEPNPPMSGRVLIDYNDGASFYRDKVFYERKLPYIYWAARNAKAYIETNHTFIKCFADLAVKEFGDRLKVIYLHRNKLEVARSYHRRASQSQEALENQYNWILKPGASRNLLSIEDILKKYPVFDSVFYRCLWYCYETEARSRNFVLQYPHVPVVALDTQDLNSPEKISLLLRRLEMAMPETLLATALPQMNFDKRDPGLPTGIHSDDVIRFQSICDARLKRLGLNWEAESNDRIG